MAIMEPQLAYNRTCSLPPSDAKDFYLRVGDTVILTKTQIIGKAVKGSIIASLLSARSRTLAVKAEGLIDKRLYGELLSTWMHDTEMCLFRVENPLGMLRGRSTRRDSSFSQLLGRVSSSDEVAEKEARVQQEANRKGLGQTIKYGQSILLRHVNSEGLLTLNSLGTGADHGTWEVLVSRDSSPHYFTKITLSPNNLLQKPGESIKYGDKLNIEFTAENQQYLLHVSKSAKEDSFEVNASHLRSNWEFRKYESHFLNREAIRCGVPVMLKLGRRKMMVTEGFDKQEPVKITQRLRKSSVFQTSELSQSANFSLLSEPQSAGLSRLAPKGRLSSSSDSNLSLSILSGLGHISASTLVKKLQLTTDANDCGVVWILEKATPLQGGALLWEDRFYLKNVKSGQYVTNSNLELKSEPNPDFTLLVVKPESFQGGAYVPVNYPIIIKASDGLFLSPAKVVSEEEYMVDIVPTRHFRAGTSVTYESKLCLTKDQDAENPLEITTMDEIDYLFFIRVTKLIPKVKGVRSTVSSWMGSKDSLLHLNYVEKEDEIKNLGYNFCSSLNVLERMLEESISPEMHAKQRCNIVGLGLTNQLIELATLLVDFSTLPKRPEELEESSFVRVAVQMEEKIWLFLRILVENLPFVCEILAAQDRVMMNLLHSRKELVGPVLTEVYRVLDPEIKDVRAFFKGWIDRVDPVTAQNVIDQTVFFQLIKNVCEVDDMPKPEYQRALISLLYEEKQFFLLKLYKEQNCFFVHFFAPNDADFLAQNPDLVSYARTSPDGLLVFQLQDLTFLPNYLNYVQEALGLITVLCKGKVSQAREVAVGKQGLAMKADDIHALLTLQQVDFCVVQALVDLVQVTVLTTPPLVSFRELEAENYCYEEEKVGTLDKMNNSEVTFYPPGLSDKVLNMINASLSFWLSPGLPSLLHKYTKQEVLQPVLSTLRFTYALIEYNHTSSLFTRLISVVLSYILAGFSGQRGQKFVGRHWVVEVVQSLVLDRVSGDVDTEVMEFFKQVIETVNLIQLKTKRYKLNSVVEFFTENQDKDLQADSPELTQLVARLKAYSASEIPHIEEIRQFLNLSHEQVQASVAPMLKRPPTLADYLLYAVLNLYSVPSDLKEAVIRTLENSFNEEGLFLTEVKKMELLRGELAAKGRLLALKDELEPSDIITKARTELNEKRTLISLQFLRKVLFELVALLRPSAAFSTTQNILRNLSFHKTIIQLWPLINRLDQEKDLTEDNVMLAFDFKALLVSFLACFARHNPANQEALLKVLEKKHFTLDFPEYAELIFDLTHFTHMPQGKIQKAISNIVDRCANYTAHTDLNAHHFLRLMMLSAERKELSSMQNLIARYIAEKYRNLPEFDIYEENCYKDVVFLELLSRAAVQNPSITIMCREMIPFGRLEVLFEKHSNPAVLNSLLSFLTYVYLWPVDDKSVKPLNPFSVLGKIVAKLHATLKPLFGDSARLLAVGKKSNYELVYEEGQWPMVDVNIAREPFEEERNVWRLLCFQYIDDKRPGGFLSLVPWIFKYADSPEKLHTQAKAVFEDVQKLENSLCLCIEEGICVNQLEKAISGFKTEFLRCYPGLGEPSAQVMKPRSVRDLRRMLSYGVSTIVASTLFPSFLELFAKAYSLKTTFKPSTFTKKIARRFLRFTGLGKVKGTVKKEDIETNVINLGRLHRLFTQTPHTQEYFSILTHILPDDHQFKVKLNRSYIQSGVIDEAVDELLQPSLSSANAALMFLNKLLDEQDLAFQQYFQILVDRSERSYYLFSRIKDELHNAKSGILSKLGLTPSGERAMLSERDVFLVRSLKFLQLCCDNCNIDFQNYIRQQGNQIGKADVDLVSEVAQFLIDIQDKAKELSKLIGPGKIIIKAIGALLDFVTGPCPENQERLGNNVLLFQAVNRFMKATQMELDEISIGIHNNIILFLLTLLEKTPHPSVPLTMGKFLDLKVLREGVEKIYSELVKGHEEDMYRELRSKQHMSKIRTAILQAILLLKLKKYSNHLELKKFMTEGSAAYEFYTSNIGYVQVDCEGSIEELYFPVPFMCKFLTPASRQSLIFDINRSSHQSKIEDFLDKVDYYHTEMQHQQHLSQHRWLKSLSKLWKLYAQLSYIMVLLLNGLLLCTLTGTEEKTVETYHWLWIGLLCLGLMQLLLYVASFVFNMIEYFPLRLRNTGSYESLEIDKYSSFPDNESYLLTDTFKSIELANRDTTSFKNSLRNITQNLDFYYNFIYLLVAVLGLYEPLIYPILLLDIIKQNQELVNILKSITVNLRQLLLTLVLGLIIIFLFSVHSFGYFQKYYNPENNADCSNLYNCFTSTLYFGIRAGGGIGDGLDPASSEDYWARMAFDLLYYVIMIIILLNIIFGIIIDTFAQLRDERSQMAHDLSNTCFVCGSSRSEIELKGKGWSYHFMCEHSPFSYLAFFVFLKETNIVDCSGVEKYVKEKLLAKDSSFMPTTSKLLQMKAPS